MSTHDSASAPTPVVTEHTHAVHNGKRELTIDELAMMQPGMDRLMAEVGHRVHRLYYAAKAGNWKLAEYFYTSTVKQLRLCATSRPKYAGDMAAYLEQDCAPVREALRERDQVAFDAAYERFVDRANHYHDVYKKQWLHWKTPDTPPNDLDLTAGLDT
ncbi:MAG TPA: hypothetical protein VHA79_11115 [Mycobacteriales bacterium]|nr:hypothetical protein [Mycobacteriales bacterium]